MPSYHAEGTITRQYRGDGGNRTRVQKRSASMFTSVANFYITYDW